MFCVLGESTSLTEFHLDKDTSINRPPESENYEIPLNLIIPDVEITIGSNVNQEIITEEGGSTGKSTSNINRNILGDH